MEDYSNGKIYKLYSVSNEDLAYYGSTNRNLNERLREHINDYKNNRGCTSKKVIAAGDYKIELIENYPCNSNTELERKEGEYTKNNKCVNKVIPCRTQKEWREDNKEKIAKQKKIWNEVNKEKIIEQKKEWHKKNYKDNKEQLLEKSKKYRENNKEKIAEKKKEYYENNKEKIAEKQNAYGKEKVTCECGCIIRRDSLAKHKKSNKHLELMND